MLLTGHAVICRLGDYGAAGTWKYCTGEVKRSSRLVGIFLFAVR